MLCMQFDLGKVGVKDIWSNRYASCMQREIRQADLGNAAELDSPVRMLQQAGFCLSQAALAAQPAPE